MRKAATSIRRPLGLASALALAWLASARTLPAAVSSLDLRQPQRPGQLAFPPTLDWVANTNDGLVFPASCGDEQALAVTSGGRLLTWDLRGRQRLRVNLPSAPTSAPLQLSELTWLTTHQGTLLGVAASGRISVQLQLPLTEPTEPARLLAMGPQQLAVISGSDVVLVNCGHVVSHVRARSRISTAAVTGRNRVLLWLNQDGELFRWPGHLEPEWIHRFPSTQATISSDSIVFAQGPALHRFWLATRLSERLGALASGRIVGSPIDAANAWWVWTSDGQLAAFPKPAPDHPKTLPLVAFQPEQSPPPLALDSAGRATLVSSEGRLIQWNMKTGAVTDGAPVACSHALGLQVSFNGSLLLSCASGQIYSFGPRSNPRAE